MPVETEKLSLKMPHTDKVALQHLAIIEGEPMSVVTRRILRNELRRCALLPVPDVNGRQEAQDVVDKDIYPEAKPLATQCIENSAISLLIQLVAFGQKASVILQSHIDEVRNTILSARKQARSQELRITLGSVFLGAFAQGFTYEVSLATPRPLWIAIYIAVGFVGLFLVLWGY
jgi:hypothetical protein